MLSSSFWHWVSAKLRPLADVNMAGKKIGGLPTTGFPTLDGDAAHKKYVDDNAWLPPTGLICMWSGTIANIPTGWALCDGGNGRPDLRSKFIRGAPQGQEPGGTGGADNKTLVEANLPSHTHEKGTLAMNNTGSHHHHWGHQSASYRAGKTDWGWGRDTVTQDNHLGTSSNGNHAHSISGATAARGSGTPFDNRPAFYQLAFIIYVGGDGDGGGGVDEFKELIDTPDTYVGQANKMLKVKATEDGLEFIEAPGGGDMLKSIYDPNDDGIVKDSDKLAALTLSEVRDHTPQSHALTAHSVPTSNLDMNNKKIDNLADPEETQQAATKAYADTKLGSPDYESPWTLVNDEATHDFEHNLNSLNLLFLAYSANESPPTEWIDLFAPEEREVTQNALGSKDANIITLVNNLGGNRFFKLLVWKLG